jgi:hypothetical protein
MNPKSANAHSHSAAAAAAAAARSNASLDRHADGRLGDDVKMLSFLDQPRRERGRRGESSVLGSRSPVQCSHDTIRYDTIRFDAEFFF